MLVRRLPIGARVILGPLRHVLRFSVGEFVILALVLSFALDVIGLGDRRLSAQARSRFDRQMKNRHVPDESSTNVSRKGRCHHALKTNHDIPVTMIIQDEARLRVFQSAYESKTQDFREKLAQKKVKLKAAEARIRARISVRERKRRTRCLILIGSYIEHVTQTDPDRKARLMQRRDGFLGRRFYRQIFGLVLLIPVVMYAGAVPCHCAGYFSGCCGRAFRGDGALPSLARMN